MGLDLRQNLEGGFTQSVGGLTYSERFGASPAPDCGLTLADGTGDNQANQVFAANFSIAASATQSWDMKGGGGELDVLNVALAMTAIKSIVVKVTTPTALLKLLFGPQAVANAWQGPFFAVTANYWVEVWSLLVMQHPLAGWAVGASTKILSLSNPSASTIAGKVRVVGTK